MPKRGELLHLKPRGRERKRDKRFVLGESSQSLWRKCVAWLRVFGFEKFDEYVMCDLRKRREFKMLSEKCRLTLRLCALLRRLDDKKTPTSRYVKRYISSLITPLGANKAFNPHTNPTSPWRNAEKADIGGTLTWIYMRDMDRHLTIER